MDYFKFRDKIKDLPYFETRELKIVLRDDFNPAMLVNLKNWMNKGHLVMLRRGLYLLADLKNEVDVMVFAGKLYSPSYISLETALSFYGIIPEAVFTTTSVTTRKTKKFQTPLGYFSYQKIKKEAFGGFEAKMQNGISYKLALPEKALVDFFYLNRNIIDGSQEQFESYRFNKDFKFSKSKLRKFAKIFQNKKTSFLINQFIKWSHLD